MEKVKGQEKKSSSCSTFLDVFLICFYSKKNSTSYNLHLPRFSQNVVLANIHDLLSEYFTGRNFYVFCIF